MHRLAFAALLFATAAYAEPTREECFPAEPDPLMGNYVGRWSANVETDPDVAAQVIPLGDGMYRINFVTKLDIRCPIVATFEAKAENGVIAFRDETIIGELRDGKIAGTRGEETTFAMTKTEKPSPTLNLAPPDGAVVLFDGTNLDAWEPAPGWEIVPGGALMVTPDGEYITSKQSFGDCRIHIEFRTPYMPAARGQARGNSGLFIQGIYEVQILDSFGLPGYYDDCGGLYKLAAAKVNATRPPLQWQTYDITYRAPRYAGGTLTENARITVVHNGNIIHNDQELWWITGWTEKDRLSPAPNAPGPIKLQGHDNYVQFRNIWVQPLAE